MPSQGPLGKGLSSLISEDVKVNVKEGYIPDLKISSIQVNPFQPRKSFDETKLKELADNIKENGILSPIIVTKSSFKGDKKYQLVAGERRLRASIVAGLETIPAIVRDLSDDKILLMALMENIQREDLTLIEESEALYQLQQRFKISAAELSRALGVPERTVQAKIKVHFLPKEVKANVDKGLLTTKHALLLGRVKNDDDMIEAMNIILRKRLTGTETEDFIKRFMLEHPVNQRMRMGKDEFNRVSYTYESNFRRLIGEGYRVLLRRTYTGGSLIIRYKDDQELEKLQKRLSILETVSPED